MQTVNPINPRKIPRDLAERNEWVIAQLKLRGHSLASIARAHGWSRRTPSNALRLPNFPAEKAIAEALGTSPELLFFERYDKTGRRLHHVRKNNINPPRISKELGGGR